MDWRDPNIAKRYKPGEALTGPFALALVKRCFLEDDSVGDDNDLVVLDNATGTGIVTVHIYGTLPDAAKQRLQLTCGDISPGMIEAVQGRIDTNGWKGATAKIMDMQKMDVPTNTYTHIITNFGLVGPMSISDPTTVLAEWHRALRPGGLAAFTIWEHVGWYAAAERAVQSLGPGGPKFPNWHDFCHADYATTTDTAWEQREYWQPRVEAVGFEDVRVEAVENVTRHGSARELCDEFGASLAVIVQKFWSEEEKARFGPELVPALERALREQFGEGDAALVWRAWVVTARKPVEK